MLLFGRIFSYRIKDGDEYDDQGKYTGEQEPQRLWYIPSVSVMRMYNTLEVVKKVGVSYVDGD